MHLECLHALHAAFVPRIACRICSTRCMPHVLWPFEYSYISSVLICLIFIFIFFLFFLQVGQEVVYLECFHAFHATCVYRWTETKGAETSCPLCKRLIFPAATSLPSPQNVTAPPPSTLVLSTHSSASRRHSVSAPIANAHTHSTQRTPASRPASAQAHRQVLSLLPLLVQKYKY